MWCKPFKAAGGGGEYLHRPRSSEQNVTRTRLVPKYGSGARATTTPAGEWANVEAGTWVFAHRRTGQAAGSLQDSAGSEPTWHN